MEGKKVIGDLINKTVIYVKKKKLFYKSAKYPSL